MRSYSILFTVLVVALLGIAAVMAQQSTDVMEAFSDITNQSASLTVVVQDVKATTVFTLGPKIVNGFQAIIRSCRSLVAIIAVPNPKPYPDEIAVKIVVVLTKFVQVHQALLKVVIGKHGLFATFSFTAPIAAVLRGLEGIVDKVAFGLIALIPTQKDAAMVQITSLSITIKDCVKIYSS